MQRCRGLRIERVNGNQEGRIWGELHPVFEVHSFRGRGEEMRGGKCLVIRLREGGGEIKKINKKSTPAAAVWGARAMLPAACLN